MSKDTTMTDDRWDDEMKDALRAYRVPQEPPLEAMWARIEREHFEAPLVVSGGGSGTRHPVTAPRPARRWLQAVAGMAATLVVGFGLGRLTTPGAPGTELPAALDVAATTAAPVVDPLQRAASAYLDDAQLLLASLPRESSAMDTGFVADSRQMLMRTRLLLDSPVGADPRMREILEDLELVLAQLVRLRAAPRAEELTFIADAMNERDVMPRLRTVAAAYSTSDY